MKVASNQIVWGLRIRAWGIRIPVDHVLEPVPLLTLGLYWKDRTFRSLD